MNKFFEKFKKSSFGLEIWSGGKMIFHSKKSGIRGLSDFIGKSKRFPKDLIIFDKKVGNAVALLCVYLKVKEVYGVLGSETAKETLNKFKIKFEFLKTISCMTNKDGTDICPMEKLSFSETPESFVRLSKIRFAGN